MNIKNKIFFSKRLVFTICLYSFLIVGCIPKSKVVVSLKKNQISEPLSVDISKIQVVNHQIIITGSNLNKVSSFKIKEGSTHTNLQIESKTSSSIVANTISNVTFSSGKIFDFILSSAHGASTFTVDFSLCDSKLGGKGFNCLIAPTDKQVLSYDLGTGKWRPRSINGLNYQGTWSTLPALPPAGVLVPGDYYIISVAHGSYNVGDWIVLNQDGVTFEQVENSAAVISVFGRNGNVVAAENDYDLDKMGDVNLTIPPISGDSLVFDGSQWIAQAVSGGATPIGTAGGDLAGTYPNPTIGNNKIIDSHIANAAISQTKINGLAASFAAKESAITSAATTTYFRGDKTFVTLNSSVVPEGSNLYFTNARTLGILLTGFDNSLTGSVSSTDSMIQGFGRLQNQINSLSSGGSNYLIKNSADTISGTVTLTNVITASGTGDIIVPSIPLTMTSAVNKTYADGKLDKTTGGTVAGIVTLDSDLKVKGGSNYVTIKGHATSANYNLVLPSSAGAAGYVLSTDGSGNTSWITAAGGGAPTGIAGGDLSGNYPNPTITALDAAKVGSGAISNTEFSYLDGVTSSIQTQLAAKEPAITAAATTTYLRGDKTFVTLNSTIVPEGTNLYFTNARALGVPLAGFDNTLTGQVSSSDSMLQGFGRLQNQITSLNTSGSNHLIKNGADTISGTVTLTNVITASGTGDIIVPSVPLTMTSAVNKTYADGKLDKTIGGTVAGVVTLDNDLKIKGGSNYITVKGNASTAVDYNFILPVNGGTNGYVLATDGSGGTSWISAGLPANSGLISQVKVSTNSNITLSGTQTIDSIPLAVGDRVLVKNQTATEQNGIYVVGASTWSRSTDMDSWAEVLASRVFVKEGTIWRGMSFTPSVFTSGTFGTSSILWNTEGVSSGLGNIALGRMAYAKGTTGQENISIGNYANSSNTTGNYNIGIGSWALQNNTAGFYNIGIGVSSLNSNTTGTSNTAVGYYSLIANSVGTNNTAVGANALNQNTSGTYNTAMGSEALNNNQGGQKNSAMGGMAMFSNTSGNENTTHGYEALRFNTSGSDNTAIGYRSLYQNQTSSENTAVGNQAMSNNISGANNTSIGSFSLFDNSTGINNTATGFQALRYNSGGGYNVAVGYRALYTATLGNYNIGIGNTAGSSITTGSYNVVIGSTNAASIATLSNYVLISDGAGNERMRIDNNGNVGIKNTSPGSALDVKGTFRLSGSTSGYVGLTTAAAAGSTTYTLPASDGSNGQVLSTNGTGVMSWVSSSGAPAGSNTEIQFNNAGVLGSSSNLTYSSSGLISTSSASSNSSITGKNTSTSTTEFYGVKGEINGGNDAAAAVYGRSTSSGGFRSSGVRGENTSGTNGVGVYGIASGSNGKAVYGYADGGGVGGFFYSTTGHALITSTGNVGFGTFGPLSKLSVNGGVAVGTYAGANAAPANGFIVSGSVGIGVSAPTYQLELSTDSAAKPGTSTWTIASDERLKTIRAPFTRGLESILKINPIYFRYKKTNPLNLPSDKEYVGIIAQDAKKAIPEAVSKDQKGFLHLNNDSIIWTLLNAVKELFQRFSGHSERVKKELTSLQAQTLRLEMESKSKDRKIKDLENRLVNIEKSLSRQRAGTSTPD